MSISESIEKAVGRMLKCSRGHDANLFVKGPAFANFPNPTLNLQSRDCGPTSSFLEREYTQFGDSRIPSLIWNPPKGVKQYILLCEDPDSPLHKTPSLHYLHYEIPGYVNKINGEEITYITEKGKTWVDLGVPAKVGMYRRWTLFIGPRPLFGHGVHRYLWEMVALDQELDEPLRPTREELAKAIEGKVLGWGDWVGRYETKLEDFVALRQRKGP